MPRRRNNQLQVKVGGRRPAEYPITDNMTTSSVTSVADAGGTAMVVGHNLVTMQFIRVGGGATNISTDINWSAVTAVTVIAPA